MGAGTEPFFSFIDRSLGWKEGFEALAVRRGRPLLLRAGVPKEIASFPDHVADRATAYLLAVRDIPIVAGHESEYRAAVELLFRRTIDELDAAAGEAAGQQLREWLHRNFFDDGEKKRLWLWTSLLPRLAAAYGHGPKAPPLLREPAMQRFKDIVRSHFSPRISEEDDALAENARREPLSLLEQELVALQPSSPGDPDEADVVGTLIQAARNERARNAWKEIDHALTPSERVMLVTWARQEGALRKMPVDFIAARSTED